MANPKHDAETDDFRKALTQQAAQPAVTAPTESAWDRVTAGLREAANRSTGWAADRVRDTFQEAVSRFFGLEPTAQQPAEKEPEQEKGIDR